MSPGYVQTLMETALPPPAPTPVQQSGPVHSMTTTAAGQLSSSASAPMSQVSGAATPGSDSSRRDPYLYISNKVAGAPQILATEVAKDNDKSGVQEAHPGPAISTYAVESTDEDEDKDEEEEPSLRKLDFELKETIRLGNNIVDQTNCFEPVFTIMKDILSENQEAFEVTIEKHIGHLLACPEMPGNRDGVLTLIADISSFDTQFERAIRTASRLMTERRFTMENIRNLLEDAIADIPGPFGLMVDCNSDDDDDGDGEEQDSEEGELTDDAEDAEEEAADESDESDESDERSESTRSSSRSSSSIE